ncbi:MAG: type VI secretion system ImpA family N-terminal domain-containing protein [Cupriavidus sp.]|nr:type VI secretion system ImpA family N-terminal domain-containing protein [Cupriavidus sp.]
MNPVVSRPAMRHDDLLEPVSAELPSGEDLEYDRAFIMLQAAVTYTPEAQYGDFVESPQSVNWADAERECKALLARTKDLRLAVILLRAGVRQHAAVGLRDGLGFIARLLVRYGTALHPSPALGGEWDKVAFANAVAALADQEGALFDVRQIALPKAAGLKLQLRDLEKALASPRQQDALPPESMHRLLKELWGRRDETVQALSDAQRSLVEIMAWVDRHLDDDAPDLSALIRLLQPFTELDQPSQVAPAPQPVEAPGRIAAESSLGPRVDAERVEHRDVHVIAQNMPPDRWSALATIRQVRTWFEDNEPSSPVVVLLLQAERMVGKRFSELAQVIPPELLAQWDELPP